MTYQQILKELASQSKLASHPNFKLLDRIIDGIKSGELTHYQATWHANLINTKTEEPCGTAKCIAGWAEYLYFIDKGYTYSVFHKGEKITPPKTVHNIPYYLDTHSIDGLYTSQNNSDDTFLVKSTGSTGYIAQLILHLNCSEAKTLFDSENSLDDIIAYVDNLKEYYNYQNTWA